MYLIDTDVISELRKGSRTNAGVRAFFQKVADQEDALYLSVITIGELRMGIERLRDRRDLQQAQRLENWLNELLEQFSELILPIDLDTAQVWARLRVPDQSNALDKQIAATALLHDLTVITRNVIDTIQSNLEFKDEEVQYRIVKEIKAI